MLKERGKNSLNIVKKPFALAAVHLEWFS